MNKQAHEIENDDDTCGPYRAGKNVLPKLPKSQPRVMRLYTIFNNITGDVVMDDISWDVAQLIAGGSAKFSITYKRDL